MGISLQKEDSKEVVHHRSLLGYCWNGREESRDEELLESAWQAKRKKLEELVLESGCDIPKCTASTEGDQYELLDDDEIDVLNLKDVRRVLSSRRTTDVPCHLYPSSWMGMSDSTMALQTKKTCFTLPVLREEVEKRKMRRRWRRKFAKKMTVSREAKVGTISSHLSGPSVSDTPTGSGGDSLGSYPTLGGPSPRGSNILPPAASTTAALPTVSFTESFTQAFLGRHQSSNKPQHRVHLGGAASPTEGVTPGFPSFYASATTPTINPGVGIQNNSFGNTQTTTPATAAARMHEEQQQQKADAAAEALHRAQKRSEKVSQADVVLYHGHRYLTQHHLGILKDVFFQIAPARRRYDQVVLKGFPYYFLPPTPKTLERGHSKLEKKQRNIRWKAAPTPQPLEAHSLTASLLVASHGYNAHLHQHRMITIFSSQRPFSYPLVDQDCSNVMAAQTPVIVFAISALELLLMPPEAEVCFGGWCHVSLEDERRRLKKVLQLFVEKLEHQAQFRLPAELAGEDAKQALEVPLATHLRDFKERADDLHAKRFYAKKLKELHHQVDPSRDDTSGKKGNKKKKKDDFWDTFNSNDKEGHELWFPYAFLVVVMPMYQCGILPTTFHRYTTKIKPVSLHLRNSLSRKMFGVGCITGVRYGGLMVMEHRGRVRRDDLKWMEHFLSLVKHEIESDELKKHRMKGKDDHSDDRGGNAEGAERSNTTTTKKAEPQVKSSDDLFVPGPVTRSRSQAGFSGRRSESPEEPFLRGPVQRRRSVSGMGKLQQNYNSPFLTEDEECLQIYQRSYQPVWDRLCLTRRHIQRRLRRNNLNVVAGHTRIGARLHRTIEGDHKESNSTLHTRNVSFSKKLSATQDDGGIGVSNGTFNSHDIDNDSLHQRPVEDVDSASSCSTSASSFDDDDGEGVANMTFATRRSSISYRATTKETDFEREPFNTTTDAAGRAEEKRKTAGLMTRRGSISPGDAMGSFRNAAPGSGGFLPGGGDTCNPMLRQRCAMRQLGGMQFLDPMVTLQRGVDVHTITTAVLSWVKNLLEAPIRARPLALYLQRYEGIGHALRVGATEIVERENPPFPSAPGSFASLNGGVGAGVEPLPNMTFNMGSFRMMKPGQQSSFRGIGGLNMATGENEMMHEQNDVLAGSITHVPVVLGQQPTPGYGRARGLPFITTYTGALDPVVSPDLTPALEDMFHLYDLYDPLNSEYLLTERRSLLEQQRHGILNDHHLGIPGTDPAWIEADMTLRNLKSEWEDIQDLHQQAQSQMLERLHEYHNISSLFLPHTRVDQVTAQMVFTKMMRYRGDNVPVKELSQDWLCGLVSLLTTPYEDMFLYPFVTSSSQTGTNLKSKGGPQVLTRYASYLPEASSSPNNILLDVCEANRQHLFRADDSVLFNSSIAQQSSMQLNPLSSRPTVTYRVVAPPPVKPSTRLSITEVINGVPSVSRPPDIPPPCGVQEVVIAPQPLPLGSNYSMSDLPLGHLMTGGSIGLLAGVLMLYADTLPQRAFGIPPTPPPLPSSPRMTRGVSFTSVATAPPASPRGSHIRDWKYYENWLRSGEDILLRRLVLWGVRDGGRHAGSCCGCCYGEEDVAVKNQKKNEDIAMSMAGSSVGSPGTRTGRAPMNTLSGEGIFGYEDVAVAHRFQQSATSVSFASKGSIETEKRNVEQQETHSDGFKGLPFTSKEISALFDAIAHYLRTLRRLQYEYQQEKLAQRARLGGGGSNSTFVPETPQKSKSFLQRLFSRQKRKEKADNDDVQIFEDTTPHGGHFTSALNTATAFPAKRGHSISHGAKHLKQERTSQQSEYIMTKTFPTSFELCIGTNYFYKGSMQSEEWIHPEDYDSSVLFDSSDQKQHKTRKKGSCCDNSREPITREPPTDDAAITISSSRASLASKPTKRRKMMHFNYGKEVTPGEWKKRQQLEDPYIGGEEEDEKERIGSEAYHAKSLFRRMTKVLDDWKSKEKKRKEQLGQTLPEWERDEDIDQMIQLQQS